MNDVTIAISPVAYAIVTFLVIGTVTFLHKLKSQDWWDAATIVAAAAVGALAGHFITGVGGLVGLLVGLNGSGLVTTAIKFGLTSQAAPVVPKGTPVVDGEVVSEQVI